MAYRVVPDRQGIIQIGKIKENLVTEVELPAPGFEGGSYAVLLRRPKEDTAYPVSSRHEGNALIWTVQTADTAIAGTGKLECRWYGDNGEVAKSQTYMVRITDGLPDPTEAPQEWAGYIGQVAQNAQRAETAADSAAGSAQAAADTLAQVKDDLAAGKLKGEKGDKGDHGKDAPQIDDNTVSADSPWSSKKIVETLCPPIAETGNPVTCDPVAGYPLGVVASWEPTQAGEGEPYPAGGGPNLLDISKCTAGVGAFGLVSAIVGDVLTVKGTVTSVAPGGTSFFSVLNTPDSSLSGKGYKITAFTSKGSIKSIYGLRTETETSIAIGMDLVVGQVVDVALRIMVSKDTPTAYAPYENIRPVSGRDSVSVERCGENLLDMSVVAETKNVTVDGDKIHVVDASGWGQSYIIFDAKFPSGTYTITFYASIAKAGRVIVRTYNADGLTADAKVTVMGSTYYAEFSKYYNGYIIVNTNPSSPQKVQFTVAKTAYFQVGFAGGLSPDGETEADIINPMLVPGTTAPTAYTPYQGDTLALQLPRTVYGGNVDAVSGQGQNAWKSLTLDGNEAWNTWGVNANSATVTGFYTYDISDYDIKSPAVVCSNLPSVIDVWGGKRPGVWFATSGSTLYFIYSVPSVILDDISDNAHAIASLKSYLAAQAAAGTPVQIAYKLAEPVPFQATGNGPIMPIPGETNTVMTDADTLTVTGRADPAHAIAALQAQLATATQQLAETQQDVVSTTAMAVDYIYEKDLEDIGLEEVDDSDNQTDTEPVDVPGI